MARSETSLQPPQISPGRPGAPARTWSRLLFGVLLLGYAALVVKLMLPVLTTPVGGDDQYWLMEVPALTHGSVVEAFVQPLRTALDFPVQDRATALAFAERQALAAGVMNVSVALSVSPYLVWAAVKATLVGLMLSTAWLFLRAVRYRTADGRIRGLSRRTMSVVLLALPLGIALGAKPQSNLPINGWNNYPTLCYGLLPGVLLIATAAMHLHDLLVRDYRRWFLPTGVLLLAWAVVINFSFELLVSALPVVVLVLAFRPRPPGSLVRRWRAALTVAGTLCGGWLVVYAAIKVHLSSRDCAAAGSCYPGTQIEVRPHTVLNNFLGNLPLGTGSFTRRLAQDRGTGFPGPDSGSVFLACALIALLGALILIRLGPRRPRTRDRTQASTLPPAPAAAAGMHPEHAEPGEAKALAVVAAAALCFALVASLVTGIIARAVDLVTTPLTSYHVGPAAWPALILAVLAVIGALMVRSRAAGVLAMVLAGALAAVVVAVMLPRNTLALQAIREHSTFLDALQREVATGSTGAADDRRRCGLLQKAGADDPSPGNRRRINAAYSAFAFYHRGASFCSTRLGFVRCPSRVWSPQPSAGLPCAGDGRRPSRP